MTRLKSNYLIYVDPLEESVCSHLIAHGDWEPWISEVVLKLVNEGDNVVEVGGHVGFYTLGLAARVGATGSVLTFEANPRLAALAQRSVRFNGFGPRVRIEQKIASNQKGTMKFMVSRQFAGGSHLYLRDGMLSKDAEVIEVESVRLDDLKLPKIDLLRIDAEGSEVLILEGASKLLDNPDMIVCLEWDVVQMRSRSKPQDLITSLSAKGYRFWCIETNATVSPLKPEDMMQLKSCDIVASRKDIGAIMSQVSAG